MKRFLKAVQYASAMQS